VVSRANRVLSSSPGISMNLKTPHKPRFLKDKLIFASMLLTLFAVSFPAYAELGGDEASIQTDQVQMQGVRRIARASTHVMHEIQTPTGTKVREYVSPAGKVFGVAWEGPFLPNLQQVLGPYFEQLSRAQSNRRGRGPLIIQLPGLVFFSGGHMRAFAGQAYVPDMLPHGVTAEAIR
jgi:uncharacterized protein DUF2844